MPSLQLLNYIHNGNETWHILKSIYIENTSITFFQNDRSILLISTKIMCTGKMP